jgi:peptidyl-tRNA hydrolase/FMN phosphatase YigB (HAD superfamily)
MSQQNNSYFTHHESFVFDFDDTLLSYNESTYPLFMSKYILQKISSHFNDDLTFNSENMSERLEECMKISSQLDLSWVYNVIQGKFVCLNKEKKLCKRLVFHSRRQRHKTNSKLHQQQIVHPPHEYNRVPFSPFPDHRCDEETPHHKKTYLRFYTIFTTAIKILLIYFHTYERKQMEGNKHRDVLSHIQTEFACIWESDYPNDFHSEFLSSLHLYVKHQAHHYYQTYLNLKFLKETCHKKLFIISNSNPDLLNELMKYAFPADFPQLFEKIITRANKPKVWAPMANGLETLALTPFLYIGDELATDVVALKRGLPHCHAVLFENPHIYHCETNHEDTWYGASLAKFASMRIQNMEDLIKQTCFESCPNMCIIMMRQDDMVKIAADVAVGLVMNLAFEQDYDLQRKYHHLISAWKHHGSKKMLFEVTNQSEFSIVCERVKTTFNIPYFIDDAKTAIALGPANPSILNEITRHINL